MEGYFIIQKSIMNKYLYKCMNYRFVKIKKQMTLVFYETKII